MSDDVETGGRSPLVSDSYYHDGARWERDIYRRLELSRNAWRVVAGLIGLALLARSRRPLHAHSPEIHRGRDAAGG